jgi:hypothetical protein
MRRYVTYLTQALQRRELFAWLQLQPQVWWHTLLFRDAYNWGGMAADEAVARLQVGELEDFKHDCLHV